MPLRLVEIMIPFDSLERIPVILQDTPVIHVWTSGSPDTSGIVRVLLKAEDTEVVSDLFFKEFGSLDSFRLILLPVEGTMPRMTEPEPQEETPPDPKGKKGKGLLMRISREELFEDLGAAGKLTPIFVIMVVLSTVVAAIGLIRGDVPVIIGAMVIAPFLGPNMALALSCALGDFSLAKHALKAIGVGVAIAMILSCLIGFLVSIDPLSPQIASRTSPDLGDMVLAFAAGAAGSLAFTTGIPAVVVGVMVAVALLPPLVTAGLLLGAGHFLPAFGAIILLFTSITCINLAAISTFFLQKVRPMNWWEADKAKKATLIASVIWISLLCILLVLMIVLRFPFTEAVKYK